MNKQKRILKTLEKRAVLYLVVSEKCNLHCSYCSCRKIEYCNASSPSAMTIETAIAAIDLYSSLFDLEKNRERESTITFYGGEPLLNKKVILESIEYINEINRKARTSIEIVINTNGTLVTKEFAESLKGKNVTVVVSIDGPEKIHNVYRKNSRKKGSFNKVISGLEILKEAKIETCLSIVITPLNFSYAKDILEIARKFDIKEIGTNPLAGDTINYIEKEFSIQIYAQEAARAAKNYFEEAKKIGVREYQTSIKKESFFTNTFSIDCFAYSNQITVWPNGKVGVCPYLKDITLGNIDTSIEELRESKEDITSHWLQRLPLLNQECKDCEFREICGGGCAFGASVLEKNHMKKDRLSCEYTKELYRLFSKD